MNRIQSAYKDLFTILSSTNPFLVPLAFVLAVLSGVLPPVFVLASERLMTLGEVAVHLYAQVLEYEIADFALSSSAFSSLCFSHSFLHWLNVV